MIDFSDLSSPDPLKRELAYLLFEEALGGEWVERWARKRGKVDAPAGVAEGRAATSLRVANQPKKRGPGRLGLAPICSQICSHRLR